jgi:hypothetical protein
MAPTVAALSVGACVPTLAKSLRSARTSDRNPSLDRRAQQRDFTPRLMITPLLVGGFPDTISPRLSGSLMAARVLALSMARSAMRATGGTLPSRPDLITDDGTHRQCVRVQTFSRVGQTSKPAIFPVSQWGCRTSPAGCAARHEMALIRVCHCPCRRERMREPVPLNPACEDTGGEVSHAWRARRRLQPRPVARSWAGLG